MIRRRSAVDGLPFRVYERLGVRSYSIGYKIQKITRLFHRPVPLDQRPKPGGALCVVAPGGCCPGADVCIGGKCGGIGCSRAAGGRGQCVRSVGGGWVGGVEHPDKISRQASAASGEAFDGMGVLLVQLVDVRLLGGQLGGQGVATLPHAQQVAGVGLCGGLRGFGVLCVQRGQCGTATPALRRPACAKSGGGNGHGGNQLHGHHASL